MRTIKFRAWHKLNNQMCDVSDIKFYDDGSSLITVCFFESPHLKKNQLPSDHLELMQYTGLLDKNGKDIYEGDVVNFTEKGLKQNGNPYTVEWREGQLLCIGIDGEWRVQFQNWTSTMFFEIIGNLFENPELLEGATKWHS